MKEEIRYFSWFILGALYYATFVFLRENLDWDAPVKNVTDMLTIPAFLYVASMTIIVVAGFIKFLILTFED